MDQRKNFSAAIEAIFNAYPEEKQKFNNKSSDESTSIKPSEDDIENALK